MNMAHPSRAIIDLGAYASNLNLVRRLTGKSVDIIAVLKANAYGHGLVPIARVAEKVGARMLGVATVQEGMELRGNGVKAPILVMVQPQKEALPFFLEYDLTLTVADKTLAQAYGVLAHTANRIAPIHCKVDTGMGRQGINYEEAQEALQFISRITHLDLQGVYTHFPSADVPGDTFIHEQIKHFKQLIKEMEKVGFPYEIAHAANSAAIVGCKDSLFDAVRPGLITYGVWPGEEMDGARLLRPVLRWETYVAQVRKLSAGRTVGYGRTYKADRDIRTAVLPVGYADGYKHHLSNNADVLIRGRRCPVLGSVCMDQIVVDVSPLPDITPGETATLIGGDGEEKITAAELARRAGTIPYDILTGIGNRVHREYVGG